MIELFKVESGSTAMPLPWMIDAQVDGVDDNFIAQVVGAVGTTIQRNMLRKLG